jgi:hypothetical protein
VKLNQRRGKPGRNSNGKLIQFCTHPVGFLLHLSRGWTAQQKLGRICTRQDMSGFRGLNVWWYNREEGREEIKENKARRTPKEGNKITMAVQALYPNGNVPILINHSMSRKN